MKKIFNAVILSTLVLFTSSCLKSTDKIGPTAPGSVGAIIEFGNPDYIASGTTINPPRYDMSLSGYSNKLHVEVKYSGTGKAAPSDVTVNLSVDANTLTAHNTVSGLTGTNTYVQAPAGSYTAVPTTVTIPSGQSKVGFDITVTPSLLTTGRKNAIPLKITSASTGTISGNFGAIVLSLVN